MDNPGTSFDKTIEYLYNMFGEVVSKDVIITIVESFSGDMNLSIDAIMKICNDNSIANAQTKTRGVAGEAQAVDTYDRNVQPGCSSGVDKQISNATDTPITYAAAFNSTGAIPKQRLNLNMNPPAPKEWNKDLQKILLYHNKGYRVLIFMRGLPGSGKTFLANRIVEMCIGNSLYNFKTHICSTDDFFMSRGQYHFEKSKLSEAHQWNQNRAKVAIEDGLSPVIIDNTNVEIWEMDIYCRVGVANGYIIEVLEPETPWARKPGQLARRNLHNVSASSIKRKLENFQGNITGEVLLRYIGCSYPADKVPPVIRSIPAFQPEQNIFIPAKSTAINITDPNQLSLNSESQDVNTALSNKKSKPNSSSPVEIKNIELVANHSLNKPQTTIPSTQLPLISLNETAENFYTIKDLEKTTKTCSGTVSHALYKDVQKQLAEMEKVEQDWENGENWNEEPNCVLNKIENSDTLPKPQRFGEKQSLLETVNNCPDWTKISMFMPPWQDNTSTSEIQSTDVETMSSSTCMEMGDFENKNNLLKVITAYPRNINIFHIPLKKEKIPQKRMLDKSSMTNDFFSPNVGKRCQSEHKHFKELRKLFRNVSKEALQEIFDKCMGDVNWAVEIVLDGVASKQLQIIDENNYISDGDEDLEVEEHCNCLSAYNILPDKSEPLKITDQEIASSVGGETLQSLQKKKKENHISDSSLILKQEIEKHVSFSDNHYSQHCLKIMKSRNGEIGKEEEKIFEETVDASTNAETLKIESDSDQQDNASCLPDRITSDDEDSYISMDYGEKNVNINLGFDFVNDLDKIFGRTDMIYPDEVIPKINIPMSLLNEINALWIESLMHQLDEEQKRTDMLKEDEELARNLTLKEEELAKAGKEQEVPDLKEIMDMDLALSIYRRDVAEWKNNEPNDLAAKLTREKLYNLFPDVSKDLLSELLMAHENNFQATVEGLLVSTGKSEILEEKNGLNKFVMKKEIERQEKTLQEERKALADVEWPLLPRGEVVEMSVVNNYRDVAERHLVSRNRSHQKANEYVNRGMLHAASFYSELAAFHKLKYEQSNSFAVVSLMQIHARNCPNTATIDLHFLRVSEARESLDLFLDTHIQSLRETQGRSPRFHTLYFITGRGLHSKGKPKIKPAIKKRLQERGLAFSERNPGLLTARVSAEELMTYQI